MEKFIGTKIVQAEPAMKCWGHKGEAHDAGLILTQKEFFEKVADGWEATEISHGYAVVYEDGYRSWSPADVFEAAYRRTDGMNFGLALEAAKMGKKISRAGWNGKGQYVELGTCFQYTSHSGDVPKSTCVQHTDIGSAALVFVGTRGRQVGWLASQADMLADDWMLLPDCGMMSWPQAEEAIRAGKAVCRLADDWNGVDFVGLIEELAGKVCMVTRDGTIHPDWQPSPDDLTGSDWFEVYLPGKEN